MICCRILTLQKKFKMVCKGKIVNSKMIFHGLYQFINQIPRIPQMMYYKFWDIIYAWYYLPSPYTFKYYSTKNNISNCLSTKFSYGISICTDSWYMYAICDNRSFGSMTIAPPKGSAHNVRQNIYWVNGNGNSLARSKRTMCGKNRSIWSMAIVSLGGQHALGIAGQVGQCLISL